MLIILAVVIALVAWSLHLMQQAIDRREFSLMLAGTLVAFSAAAMVAVYFLMGSYVVYITEVSQSSPAQASIFEFSTQEFPMVEFDKAATIPIGSSPI